MNGNGEGIPEKSDASGSSGRFGRTLKVIEVLAKVATAGAIVFAAYLGALYESKMSSIAVLNQREQAESNLRASMLTNLIDPIVGNQAAGEEIKAERERLLVELLTLNFHNHFEFKPLLVEVYKRLIEEEGGKGCDSLESVARRIIDRQIKMLTLVAET